MSTTFAPAALAIAAAVFNSLWEGALIVGAVWLGLRCLPKLGAATRYAIWLCALAALVIIPVITGGVSVQASEPALDVAVTSGQRGTPNAPKAQPRANIPLVASEPAVVPSESAPATPRKARISVPQGLAVAAALVWILVALARGVLLLLDVRALAAIRRDAQLWSTAHGFPVYLSDRVGVPLAGGFLHPAIILPASLLERLHADAVETIVIHEIAHLRRYDVWTNAFARIAEALVALNPVAWFVMRRLSIEREIACDDWVVARTGAGDAFARALATLATSAGGRMPLAAPSALGSRHSIVERIELLLDSAPRRLQLSPPALGGALIVLALIAFTVQSVSPVLAYAPSPAIVAQSPIAATRIAANCTVPDRGIRLTPRVTQASDKLEWDLDARKFIARFGAAKVARFDLTVDAAGTPSKVAVLSAPPYPGMAEHVTRFLMASTYEPQLRGCIPVVSTLKGAGLPFFVYPPSTGSVLSPVYPVGWSAQHPGACKVPTVTHDRGPLTPPNPKTEFLPNFAASKKNMSIEATYKASVRVHVNDAGAATSATVVSPSGEPAFDDAVLAAVRKVRYPLDASACTPLPTEYVWNTTFGRHVFPSAYAVFGHGIRHLRKVSS
ncbi:MAG: M56 family metallopeptidase [Candidatus Eremiobacteraeota bacterium]|nr:M56 family metallopeptidase [Candidatus Eremiobacteraeota bacterium]